MEKLDKNKNTEEQLVRQFDTKTKKAPMPKLIILILIVSVLGLGSGLLIAKGTASQTAGSDELKSASDVQKGKTYGVNDRRTISS
jgi:hypothetical protein